MGTITMRLSPVTSKKSSLTFAEPISMTYLALMKPTAAHRHIDQESVECENIVFTSQKTRFGLGDTMFNWDMRQQTGLNRNLVEELAEKNNLILLRNPKIPTTYKARYERKAII